MMETVWIEEGGQQRERLSSHLSFTRNAWFPRMVIPERKGSFGVDININQLFQWIPEIRFWGWSHKSMSQDLQSLMTQEGED
jgi:hypothetical protein